MTTADVSIKNTAPCDYIPSSAEIAYHGDGLSEVGPSMVGGTEEIQAIDVFSLR